MALAVVSGMIADKVVNRHLYDEMMNGSEILIFCIVTEQINKQWKRSEESLRAALSIIGRLLLTCMRDLEIQLWPSISTVSHFPF